MIGQRDTARFPDFREVRDCSNSAGVGLKGLLAVLTLCIQCLSLLRPAD